MVVISAPIRGHGQHRAGLDGLAVDDHRTSTAVAGFTADVGAGQVELLTEIVDQQCAGLEVPADLAAVDRHRHLHIGLLVRGTEQF